MVFQLLDFSGFDDSLTPYDRIDLARLLFQIVDRLTFRVWELRPNGDLSGAEEYTVNLIQAGTNLPYSLTFRPGEPTNGKRELFLKTMDLSQIAAAVREDEGFLLDEYLIEVLYRTGLPLRQEIPDDPNRQAAYTHFVHPAGTIEIQPVEQENGSFRWQFSAEIMASARQLFMAMDCAGTIAGNQYSVELGFYMDHCADLPA